MDSRSLYGLFSLVLSVNNSMVHLSENSANKGAEEYELDKANLNLLEMKENKNDKNKQIKKRTASMNQ